MSKHNKRINIVYSTNPDFEYYNDEEQEVQTLDNKEQKLHVFIDRKKRAGKEVTVIDGFIGTKDDLKTLEKTLKTLCGGGGTCKEQTILIQGNFRDKITAFLKNEGYAVR